MVDGEMVSAPFPGPHLHRKTTVYWSLPCFPPRIRLSALDGQLKMLRDWETSWLGRPGSDWLQPDGE